MPIRQGGRYERDPATGVARRTQGPKLDAKTQKAAEAMQAGPRPKKKPPAKAPKTDAGAEPAGQTEE